MTRFFASWNPSWRTTYAHYTLPRGFMYKNSKIDREKDNSRGLPTEYHGGHAVSQQSRFASWSVEACLESAGVDDSGRRRGIGTGGGQEDHRAAFRGDADGLRPAQRPGRLRPVRRHRGG